MKYEIYTDGACSKNPGPGGYAYVIIDGNGKEFLKGNGFKEKATNNEMELSAILKVLKQMLLSPDSCCWNELRNSKLNTLNIHSDSAYCVNAINEGWLKFWKANDWKTKGGQEVKNKEIWEQIDKLLELARCEIKFIKVKGHSGNKYNELVDKLAKQAIKDWTKSEATK